MIILNFNTTVFIMSSFIIEQQIWPILRQILQPYSIGTRGDYYRGEPVLQLSIEDFNQIVKTIARSSTSEALTWCHLILESLVNSSPSVHSSAYTSTDTPSSSSSSVALSNILSPNLYTFKIMVTIAATSAWENLFYFLSRMRAAGFAPDMGLYNKLIDSCNASPETRWKFARRFLLEAAVLDKNRSKTMTTAGDAQISTFSSTTGRALSIILHGATHTTRKVSDTGMKSTQPGTAANAIAVIHTWNELQKISGTQSDSMSKDVSLAFYNIEAVSNHTVGTLALSVSTQHKLYIHLSLYT